MVLMDANKRDTPPSIRYGLRTISSILNSSDVICCCFEQKEQISCFCHLSDLFIDNHYMVVQTRYSVIINIILY